METLHEAYRIAKENDGAPGIDGVTFEAIEESGVEGFLRQIRDELITNTYRPMRARKQEIPKDGGKVRVLSIPSIRDRLVQGAVKLILEPIFEAPKARHRNIQQGDGAAAPAQSQVRHAFGSLQIEDHFLQQRAQEFFAIAIRDGWRRPDLTTRNGKYTYVQYARGEKPARRPRKRGQF